MLDLRTIEPSSMLVSPISSLRIALLGAIGSLTIASQQLSAQQATRAKPFTVVEASIDDMRKALEQRRTTSHEIVQQYLTRIALYEDAINAIITVNPHALA